MTSRLDRLFILLESGSSAVTRRAAAKQIGEVQKLYPHELHALLNRLIGYLHSTSWDTRIAAAQAVEAILKNVPAWTPELFTSIKCETIKKENEREDELAVTSTMIATVVGGGAGSNVVGENDNCRSAVTIATTSSEHNCSRDVQQQQQQQQCQKQVERLLSFAEFDLEQILHKGARLIGSEGIEFDLNETDAAASSSGGVANATTAERLSRQRALLNEKLGLTQASKLGVNLTDMITDEDVMMTNSSCTYNVNEEKVPVEDILNIKPNSNLIPSNGQQLSCREMNRAKRKARQNTSTTVGGSPTVNTLSRSNSSSKNGANMGIDEPERKKTKTDTLQRQEVFYTLNDPVPDSTGMWIDAIKWPLENFCARLYIDLFNPRWEVRHGAATALRELINNQASGAGKAIGMTREQMEYNHNLWMEDAALRLLCVLCLDRFGDFVSDQVVAPVRETCSQVLGTIAKEMNVEQLHQTVKLLVKLLKQKEWEVRHGGLLGLMYVFVVREDLLPIYVPQTINDILLALFDAVDDVGAVAASTLIPIATWLPKLLNPAQVSSIVKMLWDLLLDQDELTSACNSYMGLLAAILCLPSAGSWIQMEPMSTLVPRLWPFLSHSTTSVRKSTLLTLHTLTSSNLNKEKIESTTCKDPTASSTTTSQNNENDTSATKPNTSNTRIAINFDSKKLNLNLGVIDWHWKLLQDALRFTYERILVEPHTDIQEMSSKVWNNLLSNADLGALLHAACPVVSSWICLAMQPPRLAFDSSILIHTSAAPQSPSSSSSSLEGTNSAVSRRRLQRIVDDLGSNSSTGAMVQRYFLGGNESTPQDVRERNVIRARVTAARMLGKLSTYLVQPAPGVMYTTNMESPMDCYTKVLLGHLNSRSAVQRIVCGLIIAFWAQLDFAMRLSAPKLTEKLHVCVMENVYYDEVAVSFTRLMQEAHDLIATLKQYKIPVHDFNNARVLTLDQIEAISTHLTEGLQHYLLKPKLLETLKERRRGLQNSFAQTSAEQCAYNISAQAALAGAIVCMQCLPEKLNPIVKPLMESIKREECELLQQLSAEFLVQLMHQVCDRNPSPNSKIMSNLCTLLKSDPQFTPKIVVNALTLKQTPIPDSAEVIKNCVYYGILTLNLQQNNTTNEGNSFTNRLGAAASGSSRGPGRPSLSETISNAEKCTNTANVAEMKRNHIQHIGAACAISKICTSFKTDIFNKIPIFEQILFAKIIYFTNTYPNMELLWDTNIDLQQTNDLMTSLQLIEIAAPHFFHFASESTPTDGVVNRLCEILPHLSILITHPLKAVRHMVARCIAALATADLLRTMHFVLDVLLVMLVKIENVIQRQGAIEAIERIVDKLQLRIIPYIVLLVVPLLGCMSDPDESVRLLSTHCFATLVQLMPLDSRSKSVKNEIPSVELQQRKIRDREFLDYLFMPKTIPDYKVPVPLTVELRSYQQAGVNWLWFLNKYNLHGILCDDMGLGKTLQTICILAGDHYQCIIDRSLPRPSLVICPPTLTGHWVYEVEKFLAKSPVLRPLHYVGLPIGREKLRTLIGPCNLVVASYDTVRKDIDFFNSIHWNYCVLDEGHIIKNGKTKSSKAIKMLKAKHRLILSGTPIQNNVLELWSLFDFLMPGFLGTEKQFIARYSRPILVSRDSKSSSKEQEAGVLAMEALHRQILPFLLRRVKEDVLTDLPPKITQDLLCELSPLQERLYEDFSRTHLNTHLKDCLESMSDDDDLSNKSHIFHDLRYLQNVCNHPKLVLTPKHSEYSRITHELQQHQSSLDDIEHSAKLPALKQLLLDCGIGVQTESVSQHRALIFCQLKAMLNIVEHDLLRKHMPSVTYLRLDGSVPASQRQDIVNNFNTDPSIDVLLLTTQVGGLGLNLTGADTVIFVEHDWNPMKDLQAMDRAHRIGQKKVVNVYRLITQKTLEEKIMGLQKFKILTANTVVSAENASMDTMATGQLFDLFNRNGKNGNEHATTTAGNGGQMSMNAIIESLPELWSEQQYDEEYDVSNFIQGLKK